MGQQCTQFRFLSEPAKLHPTSLSKICEACRSAETDADFEGHQRAPSVEYKTIKAGENPLKARLEVLKRNLVAQMLGMPGRFQEAVQEVRAWWRIDDPQTLLPPPSEDGCFPDPPALSGQTGLAELYDMWSHHPQLGPITWGTGKRPGELYTWTTDQHTAYRTLVRRWEINLKYLLLFGGVPEEQVYSGEQRIQLPWLRFAAACVLYRPPVEVASVFAEYGGLPMLPGEEVEGELPLGVQTERQRRESQKGETVHAAVEKFILERMWENRRELPDDYRKAYCAVMKGYSAELMALQDQMLEEFEQAMEDDPPPHKYYIEFVPEVDKYRDGLRRLKAI